MKSIILIRGAAKHVFCAVLLSLAMLPPSHAASDRPRLWKISDSTHTHGRIFYILGVSHRGFDQEYDDYFVNKVLPIFDKADLLYSEAANLNKFQLIECPTHLIENQHNRDLVASARSLIAARFQIYLDNHIQNTKALLDEQTWAAVRAAHAKMAETYANSLSEYGLLGAINDYPLQANSENAKPQIAVFLRERKPSIGFISIDRDEDLFDAYCAAGSSRVQLLKIQLEKAVRTEEASAQEKQNVEDEFRRSLEERSIVRSDEELSVEGSRAILCDRNKKWVRRMVASDAGTTAFYALGLGHLLPAKANNVPCEDVLTMLRREGMLVELVN